ncbi:MAG: RNA-binding transcriptional accessory protein [Defluviitaleaceae bacterium]|nr:RNA-binding transcriptional accessory protein [Defluviitaleaceae bacterium]
MKLSKQLAQEFTLAQNHVDNIITLIDEGNTIPFIARYRKEATGEADDQILRKLGERLEYLRNLEDRKAAVTAALTEQGNLTDALAKALAAAATLTEVEDIYRPYKPKRRTRATVAMEKGLAPLAEIIFAQEIRDLTAAAVPFINPDKEVNTAEEALAGAADIIAEQISDDAANRTRIRNTTRREGLISVVATKKVAEAEKEAKSNNTGGIRPATFDKAMVYEMYFDFAEPVAKIAPHRVLAINRGENEGWLKVNIEATEDNLLAEMNRRFTKPNPATRAFMEATIADSYKRLIAPSIEREIRAELTEQAEENAMHVFAENLRQLLMQPPVANRVVLAIDPSFRTGCKLAVVDATGKVLDVGVVYCTTTKDTAPSKKSLLQLMTRHNASVIAIGNGTASRETELIVAEMLKESGAAAQYVIVNEAGASVYSASPLGAEEFPEYDVALRSAISIGRRLQDPLAELVKIDPRSMGVGQYQHDMNQKKLSNTLGGVVEDCVNAVGIDLNTASPSVLSYVAGITPAIAKNILTYREENGAFQSRTQLKKVAKLGPKAYEQCAGFLRIPGGKNPLDNTSVHPESYAVATQYLAIKNKNAPLTEMAATLQVGTPTLIDIIRELEKPGRDPRTDLPAVRLRSDVLRMEDLTEGMTLTGTVRNVIDFGAFVDIGVHQDGLVHISQMADRYIKHPLEVVQVGDEVQVKVVSVDIKKKRIALTMRG